VRASARIDAPLAAGAEARVTLLLRLDAALRAATRIALWVSAAAILFLLVAGTADTLGSQLLGVALPSAIEMQEAAQALVIFCALAAVQRERAHIVMDVVVVRLSGRPRRAAEAFALLCILALFALLTLQAFELAARSWVFDELSPGFVAFPLYPIKGAVFLASLTATLEVVRQLAWLAAGGRDPAAPARPDGAP
jgi:TRAP-type C4-dicarboxylate transport system permease small subunit